MTISQLLFTGQVVFLIIHCSILDYNLRQGRDSTFFCGLACLQVAFSILVALTISDGALITEFVDRAFFQLLLLVVSAITCVSAVVAYTIIRLRQQTS